MARGIARFWPFPHSQIYSETEYLTDLGLLAEQRESHGRRRRTFRLTDAGRQALESWLREPTSDAAQIRSYAFLQLYFGYFARPEDVTNLARRQIEVLEAQLGEAGQMIDRLKVRADRKWQKALAEMFADFSRALLDSWTRVAAMAARESRAGTGATRRPRRRQAG